MNILKLEGDIEYTEWMDYLRRRMCAVCGISVSDLTGDRAMVVRQLTALVRWRARGDT